MVHLPGTHEMLSMVPGLVACDDVLPIALEGDLFSLGLMPAAGETWGTVDDAADLVEQVRGFF